jgi:DNA-binding LacI/PurR family transcriptional regulator
MTRTSSSPVTGRTSLPLARQLRERIAANEFAPGEFLPSVRKLSAELGVATNTVHRALRTLAEEGLVGSEPRLGYKVLAPTVEAGDSAPVACVFGAGDSDGDWGHKMIGMFQRVASGRGVSMLAVMAGSQSPSEIASQLREAGVGGALLDVSDPAIVAAVKAAGIPAVVFDAWGSGMEVDAVIQDGFSGGMLAAEHLAGLGHQRIAWLGYRIEDADLQIVERFGGAVSGLAHRGLKLHADLRAEVPEDRADLAAAKARELLTLPEPPTAILVLWQPVMVGLLQAARELNLTPGRDFDMVGWGTEQTYRTDYRALFGSEPVPPVIVWDVNLMADAAIQRLEARRRNPASPALQIRIPTRLALCE